RRQRLQNLVLVEQTSCVVDVGPADEQHPISRSATLSQDRQRARQVKRPFELADGTAARQERAVKGEGAYTGFGRVEYFGVEVQQLQIELQHADVAHFRLRGDDRQVILGEDPKIQQLLQSKQRGDVLGMPMRVVERCEQ